MLREQVSSQKRAPLLPKLRGHFAEFLDQSFLKRLGILSPPTCVGLRYGLKDISLRGFSRQHGISHFVIRLVISSRHKASRICLQSMPTTLNRDVQHPDDLPFCVPPSLKQCLTGTGILTCFPSATLFSLALGADSPWEDYLYPGNLGLTAKKFLTSFIVTHASMITSPKSSKPSGSPSSREERSPTAYVKTHTRGFGIVLSLVTFSARNH